MKQPKLNRFMEKWILDAIEDCPEPFSARQILDRILIKRRNSQYIKSSNSVGYYLNNICIIEKKNGKNMYWRRK